METSYDQKAMEYQTVAFRKYKIIQQDFRAVQEECKGQDVFTDFQLNDGCCSFVYKQGPTEKCFQLHFSDDYPDNGVWTVLDRSTGREEVVETKFVSCSFVKLFILVSQELNLPISIKLKTSQHKDDSDFPPTESDEDENTDGYESDSDCFSVNGFHTVPHHQIVERSLQCIKSEVAEVQSVFGIESVTMQVNNDLNFVEIKLQLFVVCNGHPDIMSMWKIDKKEPIQIKVLVDECLYREGTLPKVEVYQHFGSSPILSQLKRISEAYIANTWKVDTETQNIKKAGIATKVLQGDLVKLDSDELVSKMLQHNATKHCNSKGFLIRLYEYLSNRFLTLADYCIICDQRHPSSLFLAMQKPTVCARELCIYSFQILSKMNDTMTHIMTSPEVADMLVLFARAACAHRHEFIFQPYPSIIDPLKTDTLAFSPDTVDFCKLEKVLYSIPDRISNFDNMSELKKNMDTKDILAYPLLQWLISSNQSHIVKLPPDKQLPCMKTTKQYFVRYLNPRQDEVFLCAKREYGSCFAFHGSPIYNWHSILHHGLVLASGTRMQIHGSAYGKGIYLSPQWQFANKYTFLRNGMPGLLLQDANKKVCVALCEVIKSDLLQVNRRPIWKTTRAEYVCTRFFFIFDNINDVFKLGVIDSEDPNIISEINNAMSFTV